MASMMERYGGFGAVSRIVMDFYDRVLESDELAGYFEHVDMRRLIDHQTKFVASLMGGPASYTDEQLRALHEHLAIDTVSFESMLTVLRETLIDAGLAAADVQMVVHEMARRESVIVRRNAP